MPTISVIILTYNRKELLPRAVESVINQTFDDFELIIVDNGSIDGSREIADKLALTNSRIKVIHKQKGNIGSGRNMGLDSANGEWIAFVDDDDVCDSDYLDFLINLAAGENAEISMCGAYHRQSSIKKVMTAEEAIIELQWRKLFSVAFPTKLIKRSLFDVRFSETAKYDDIELMAEILSKANRISFDGTPKYTFERELPEHNSSWTRDPTLMKLEDLNEYLEVYQKRANWLCREYPKSSKIWRYFEWSFMLSMVDKIQKHKIQSCLDLQVYMLRILRENYNEFSGSEYLQDFEREYLKEYVK